MIHYLCKANTELNVAYNVFTFFCIFFKSLSISHSWSLNLFFSVADGGDL